MTRTAERQALVDQLQQHIPQAMRERAQWLLWKYIRKPGAAKPAKVPFYVNGELRGWPHGKPKDGQPTPTQPQVEQGHELDRNHLVGWEQGLAALAAKPWMDGIGFAFLPGDGLLGVDIDGAIDPETGEVSDLCRQTLALCPSYAELSVSGTGVHIILAGETEKFKDDLIGLEVYCSSQYFTCTGRHWQGSPLQVEPVTSEALTVMREWVEESLAAQKEAKEAERAARDARHAPPAPPPPNRAPAGPAPRGQKGADFRAVNDAAMARLDAWVPTLLPAAKVHNSVKGRGYRVTSKALGRALQEDLGITPEGIWDFGKEQGCSPIDLVVEHKGLPPLEAMKWLAQLVGVAVAAPSAPGGRKGTRAAQRPEPPPEDDDAPAAPPRERSFGPQEDDELDPPDEPGADAPTGGGKGDSKAGGGKPGKKRPKEFWDQVNHLAEHFALIYGTDTVWDGANREIMKISNAGHAHGTDVVKFWKLKPTAWRRSEGGRWTVKAKNVVFDPTETCDPDTHVNLFGGFPTKPVEGDVNPMLDLVRFLCSRAADTPEGCDEVFHWLLCWLAYPLQNPGAKLRTSVLMYGDEGAGKNFLTDAMVELYGEYGLTVGQDELEDKFNDWRSKKLFVVGDEVSTKSELTHNKNRLKALITSTEVQINPKNLPRRTEANHINVWFNSNENQALALDNSDRRYLVVWTPKARERAFYLGLAEWRRAGGVAAWLHFLLHYEMTGFDPFAPAPMTKAKEGLIDLNRKSPERFWIEWSEGELDLPYWTCSLAQAYQAYLKYAQRTGDRYPATRPLFTRMLLRISDTLGNPCTEKVMKVDYGSEARPDVRATRMLCVIEPPDPAETGETLGDWASGAWRAFQKELNRFLGRGFDANHGEEPPT